MKPRGGRFAAGCLALVLAFTAFPYLAERLSPEPGLRRLFYAQTGFQGAPIESRTTDITLTFLDEQPDLPRQQFSAQWRGVFFLPAPQTVEFFAGGNDDVQLRVDGELLIARNVREGTRTIGKRVQLSAGSHRLDIDYQQFTGGMALNIQRAHEGQPPSPFQPAELYTQPVHAAHIRVLAAARDIRAATSVIWLLAAAIAAVVVGVMNVPLWRAAGAPRSMADYASRLTWFATPALLLPAVVFLIGPYTIFANNAGEFALPFREIAFPRLLRTTIVNWALLVALGALVAVISSNSVRMYGVLLFAAGLTLWGQGNLWNADYGVLAGREIDLAEHASRAPWELAVFGMALVLASILFRPLSRIAPFAAAAFLAAQLAAALVLGAAPADGQSGWIEPPADIYRFSATRNVVHIVLDEFQSDVFTDMLQHDRATFDRQFTGFTYFVDHAGTFPTTSFSMPAMLTGREYRNQLPAPEFVRDVFRRESVFEKVSRAGYDVDAMSIVPVASFEEWLGPEPAPNWKGARFRIRKPFLERADYAHVTARQLLELSLFRHVPHLVKAAITDNPAPFHRALWMGNENAPAEVRRHEAANSVAFLEHFVPEMQVGRERPVYKLIHLGVPHRPIVVDRECRFIGVTPITRRNYTDQSRCALALVASLLDRLRALGIYDSSLIVVSSDHGTDFSPTGFNGTSETLSMNRGPALPRLGAIAGTAKALMLIKPPNRAGPMTISDAPTSHVDFQSTVLGELGLDDASGGTSMFQRDPQESRTRSYGMYDFGQRFPKAYLDRLHVMSIDRRVVDAGGWNILHTIWSPAAKLPPGDVDFLAGHSRLYLGAGWSMERRESGGGSGPVTFVQAVARRGVLFIPSAVRELGLRASSAEGGTVGVAVDGRPAGSIAITAGGYHDYTFAIPDAPARAALSNVVLVFDALADAGQSFRLDRMVLR